MQAKKFARKVVARGHFFEYPRQYSVDLYQTGPRTFAWASGSFWMDGIEHFSSADSALKFATENFFKWERTA